MNDKLRAAHDKLQEAVAVEGLREYRAMLIRAYGLFWSRRGRVVWLPSRLIPHRYRPRAELQLAHELQVDMLR
jgi:hypothetical protein